MSINAYRLEKIIYNTTPTFNLNNYKLSEFLGIEEQLAECSSGFVDVEVSRLREAIENHMELELDPYILDDLKKDLLYAKENGEDYITYYVF